MKPIIILPPKAMSDENIAQLRENKLCVVVAEDPSAVKFVDPIPAVQQRTQMEDAAVKLSRILLSGRWGNWNNCDSLSKKDIIEIWVDVLIKGTPLDIMHVPDDVRERQIFNEAKAEEIRKLAREEARAERAAKKATEAKSK